MNLDLGLGIVFPVGSPVVHDPALLLADGASYLLLSDGSSLLLLA